MVQINKVHERLHNSKGWKEGKYSIETNVKNGYYSLWQPYSQLIEFWSNDKRPVIVCVAGKSLDFAIPKIKKLDPESYRLVTIDQTQFKLVEAGLKPDLMFTMDFLNFAELGFWVGQKHTAMVAPCSANTDNLKGWKGQKYIYRSVDVSGTSNAREYNQKTLLAGDIGVQYCLSNVGLSVLQFCESIKAKSYWCGLDFGFIDNKSYADGIYEKFGGFFTTPRDMHLGELGNFWTNKSYLTFGLEFLAYLNKHDYDIGYCSRGGFFDIDIKDGEGKRLDTHVRRCEIEEIK